MADNKPYFTNSLNLVKKIYEDMAVDPPSGQPAGSSSDKPKKTKKIHNILDASGTPLEDRVVAPKEPERYSRDYSADDEGCKMGLCNIGNKRVRAAAQGFYARNLATMSPNAAYNLALAQTAAFREKGLSSQHPDTEIDTYPAYRDVPDNTPDGLKEHIQYKTKKTVITNFMENAKFARRGPSSQRPKSWSKGTKAGSDKRKMREQGKREARQMNEAGDPNDFFGTTPGGETRGLGRNYGVEREDSPTFYQDEEIARINHNTQWAMKQLLPVFQKHGMDAEHAGRVDQYGFPTGAHAVSHPNFRAFVEDFIRFHTNLNKKHWKQYNRASSYHWPAILRAREGLKSLQKHKEFNDKQRTAPPAAPSTERGWPSREAQRTHAPHELGIPDDIGRYEADLSESAEELEAKLGKNIKPHQIEILLKMIKNEKAARQRAQQEVYESQYFNEEHQKTSKRTHVTSEEVEEMKKIFAKHMEAIAPHYSDPKVTHEKYKAFHTALSELDNNVRGRVKALSSPDYPLVGRHEDRLLRIHGLHSAAEEVEQAAREEYSI